MNIEPEEITRVDDDVKAFGAFVADMAKAQLEMGAAQIDSTNPNFNSKYASLPSVAKVAKVVNKYGFMITHETKQFPTHVTVRTVIAHVTGYQRHIDISIPTFEYQTRDGKTKRVDAHMIGSAITYGRRYGLAAILGIPADEDDDGNALVGEVHSGKVIDKPKTQSQQKTSQQQKAAELPKATQQKIEPPRFTEQMISTAFNQSQNPKKKVILAELQKKHGEKLGSWPETVMDSFLENLKLNANQVSQAEVFQSELRRNDNPIEMKSLFKLIWETKIEVHPDRISEFMAFISMKANGNNLSRKILNDLPKLWEEFNKESDDSLESTVESLTKWAINSHWIRIPSQIAQRIINFVKARYKKPDLNIIKLVDELVVIAVAKMEYHEICETYALTLGYTETGPTDKTLSSYISQLAGNQSIESIREHILPALDLCKKDTQDYAENSVKGRE